MIVMPETTSEGAIHLAERIRESMQEKSIVGIGEKVTASFGVTMHHSGDTNPEIIKRADKAMYQAKHNGRNQVVTLL